MKFVKIVDKKEIVIETDNKNLVSLYEREGFKEENESIEKITLEKITLEKKHK